MAWQDNLQPASFKGLPFLVGSISGRDGRRVARHALIGGGIVTQDLGETSREFSVQAYFVQNAQTNDPYTKFLDFRRAALQDKGRRGTFVHPHYGSILKVKVLSIRNVINAKKQGYVSFSMLLDANEEDIFKQPSVSPESKLLSVSAQIRGVVTDLVTQVDNLGNVTQSIVTDITGSQILGDVVGDLVDERVDSAVRGLGPLNFGAGSTLARFKPFLSPVEKRAWTNTLQRFVNRAGSPSDGFTPRGQRLLSRIIDATSSPDNELRSIANVRYSISNLFREFNSPITSSNGLMEIMEFYAPNPTQSSNDQGDSPFHDTARNNDNLFNHMVALEASAAIGDALSATPIRENFSGRDDAISYVRRLTDGANKQGEIFGSVGANGGVEVMKEFVSAVGEYGDKFIPTVDRVQEVESASRNAAVDTSRYLGSIERVDEVADENNSLSLFDLNKDLELRV